MANSKDEDLESELEEFIQDGTGGKRTFHEIAETKAAEYRKRRELEERALLQEGDVEREAEENPGKQGAPEEPEP